LPNSFKYHNSDQAFSTTSTPPSLQAINKKKAHLRYSSPRWYSILGALTGIFFILLFIASAGDDARAHINKQYNESLPADLNATASVMPQVRISHIRSGDNSGTALERLGFGNKASLQIVDAAKPHYQLKNIHIGHTLKRTDSNTGIDIDYNIDAQQRLHLHQAAGQKQWQASIQKRHISSRLRLATGNIDGSLFSSAEHAGIDQRTTMNLVDIFAWDIDFARDMRRGDTFRIVYEEHFDDEGNALESSILAAEFINQGKKFQSVRYQNSKGKVDYYTPDGKGMQKTYLKAPVKFSRISSRFTTRRKHPVLGYTRAHRGVDYACPRGTPIHALGNGKIVFRGWKGGFGRFILIRHNTRIHSTAYAHMRSFARGLHVGSRVKQGQVIGYVGMSGLATGPHLHFEFRVRGRAVNPLTIKLKHRSKPVPHSQMVRFKQQTRPLMQQLQQSSTVQDWG